MGLEVFLKLHIKFGFELFLNSDISELKQSREVWLLRNNIAVYKKIMKNCDYWVETGNLSLNFQNSQTRG